MYCPNCGTEVSEDSKFCKNCGGKASISESEIQSSTEVSRTTNTNTGKGKFIKLIVGFIIIFSLANLFCTLYVETPAKVTKKFFDSMDAGDVNTIITCLDPKYESVYNSTSKIASGLLGSVIGEIKGIDLKDFISIIPYVLGDDFKSNGSGKYDVEIVSTEIKVPVINMYTGSFEGIGSMFGQEARVTFTINNKSGSGRGTYEVILKKFSGNRWRLIE